MLSLRSRVSLIILIALAPAVALVVYLAYDQRADAERRLSTDAAAVAEFTTRNHSRTLESAIDLLRTVSTIPAVVRGEPGVCTEQLAQISSLLPFALNVAVADRDGTVICSGLPIEGQVSIADRAYFQRAIASRGPAIGEAQVGRITGGSTLNVALPIEAPTGTIEAVVYMAIDAISLSDILEGLPLRENMVHTLMDGSGGIVARHPDPELWIGQEVPAAAQVRAALAEGRTSIRVAGVDGVTRLYAIRSVAADPSGDLVVLVGISRDEAYASINRSLIGSLAALAMVAVVALAGSSVIAHMSLMRPTRKLLDMTRRLSAGDLSARTDMHTRTSELDELGQALDEMARSLESRDKEMKAAADALRESEERLRAIVSNVDVVLLLLDEDGTIVACEGRAIARIGMTAEELIGVRAPIDREELARAYAGESSRAEFEVRGVTVEVHLTPLVGEDGRVAGVIGVAVDVTQERWAKEALRSAAERFERLFEHNPYPMIVVDHESLEILEVNGAALSFYGRNRDDLVSGRLSALFTDEEAGEAPFDDIDSSSFLARWRHQAHDGLEAEIEAIGHRIDYAGRPAWMIVIEDVTARTQTERLRVRALAAEQSEQVMAQLLRSVSHEIRTPLAVIRGYASTIIEYGDKLEPSEANTFIRDIDRAAGSLERLVGDLLTLTRIEGNVLQLQLTEFKLSEAIDTVVSMLSVLSPGRQFHVSLAGDDVTVYADRVRVEQVLRNLIENADKYSPPDRPIEISASREAGRSVVRIRDYGPGVPKEVMSHLFDAFFRNTPKSMPRQEGTGLGLTIARGIAQALGGSLRASLPEGGGMELTLKLPSGRRTRRRNLKASA